MSFLSNSIWMSYAMNCVLHVKLISVLELQSHELVYISLFATTCLLGLLLPATHITREGSFSKGKPTGWPQKVSHYHESSLNRIKTRY